MAIAAEFVSSALREFAALPVRAYLHTYHQLRISGRENIPRGGSFIMIANHASHLDALCLLAALPLSRLGTAFPAAAADYFSAGLPRVALAAGFVNAVPFARREHVRQSMTMCRRIVATPGNILILFPEGTRSATGQVGEFRPGIGSLLAGSDLPVVPCAVRGAFAAWPKGALIPRPGAIELMIGAARRYPERAPGHHSNHQIAGELRTAVQGLLCG